MPIKIVADSCCDLNDDIKRSTNINIAPLTIELEGEIFRDDENLDIQRFTEKMRNSKESPKTSCPSPQEFIKHYEGEESVFVVTLSAALSGTYRSAMMAKEIFTEEIQKKFIHVFNSKSASVGETLISLKIAELCKLGNEDSEIVSKVEDYISGMKTFFMLNTLENLVKAGRVSPIIAKVTSLLSIKPIMAGTEEGTIKIQEKVVGAQKAFKRFVEIIGEQGVDLENKVLGIAHCNCLDKALEFKNEVLKRYKFKDIIIVPTAGISTVYANEGGLVIAF
ncbi:EDD domain protein, DegV family [Caloramator quimbayensis]|uniref:EDD domain protein, DegV family n=1 Tax=Caloramator quimbayensis TaxID=1147123 RepID=A0A1T4YCY3_9CLOT|nr:DegV family protein [Caloramator quimbayensis]SKA99626.1 EDD domain protein, DegV family [Caloramator quimbayensis]